MVDVRVSAYPTFASALAAVPEGGTLRLDVDSVLTKQANIARAMRLVRDPGRFISGHGVRVTKEGVNVDGFGAKNVQGRAVAIANDVEGTIVTAAEIQGAADCGLVDQGIASVVAECVITRCGEGTPEKPDKAHGLWALGSMRGTYRDNITEYSGHQGLELNGARDYRVIGHESRFNKSLGIHSLRSGGTEEVRGLLKRCRTHDNQNNGVDTNSSFYVDLLDCLSWNNGSKNAEGTGILLYQARFMRVFGGAGWDNSREQPNGRDALSIAGSPDTPCTDIEVRGWTGFDTRAVPLQRSAVGLRAAQPHMVQRVLVQRTGGYGNVSGMFSVKNIAPEDDVIYS